MSNDCSAVHQNEPARFVFWTPSVEAVVHAGADLHPVALPLIPIPVDPAALQPEGPSDNAIGEGVYAYLRENPDAPRGEVLARLLQDAYPHYLADLGAQIVMLDHKEVDPPYVLRKVRYLKIFALLEPKNAGLHRQIGLGFYQLGTSFSELISSEGYLLQAMKHLCLALEIDPQDMATLNVLAEIDYLFGDFPTAIARWTLLAQRMEPGVTRKDLETKIARVQALGFPDHPFVDDLHRIGEAMELCACGEYQEALFLLEKIEEEGLVPTEMPSAEFFYLLALCRSRTGDEGGAFAALDASLAIDENFQPALEGRNRLQETGTI